nr:putative mitochondrial protein [Tanacetum cinerariifolium]
SILVPKTVGEALAHSGWRAAMIEEMNAPDHNGTWALVYLPVHKKEIGCKWVLSVKMNHDGLIARLKARLVMMIISYLALLFEYYVKKKYRGSYAYFAESGNCLFSSIIKWVIDSGASYHMI